MSEAATKESKLSPADQTRQNSEQISELKGMVKGLLDRLQKTPAYPNGVSPDQVFGSPHIRKGESAMTERGYSFSKALAYMEGFIDESQAKVELEVSRKFQEAFQCGSSNGYQWAGRARMDGRQLMVPLGMSMIPEGAGIDNAYRHEVKSMTQSSVRGVDFDEMDWISQRVYGRKSLYGHAGRKDMSWLDETRGGALTAPPEFGELIELLRAKEAISAAGARHVPLPPQGRIKYPRQTGPSTAYWVGENKNITQSEPTTGDLTLSAKKLAVLIKSSNELIRFASPAAEALMRDDMTKVLALAFDLAALEGAGGDTRPRGVINFQGIHSVASSTAGVDGDTIVPEDVYRMIAVVEEANAEFKGFIMRPKTLYKYYQIRSDAVAQGDKRGLFVWNLIRDSGDGINATLGGQPVTKSTQISQVRSKGASSNLTYIVGGQWDEMLLGTFGALEFSATTMGDTAFTQDQTWIKAIMTCDVGARHEAAFAWMDNLIVNA